MTIIRDVAHAAPGRPTLEGAGVRLRRAFGFGQETRFDPFLMLDDFRGDNPAEYEAGFPWHPHRGIETITYMLEGEVDHGDSLGNRGTIGAGDVQWMTAGSGIIHQEMPRGTAAGHMGGFQLWANMPARRKMMDPRYCGIDSDAIPVAESPGARVRVIAGEVGGVVGPVRDIIIEPEYFDVTLGANVVWTHPTVPGHTVFLYLFDGRARVGETGVGEVGEVFVADPGRIVLLGDGDLARISAGASGARFLFVSGKPLREPIAWRGPIVMSTREELDLAWRELDAGTFVKHAPAGETG